MALQQYRDNPNINIHEYESYNGGGYDVEQARPQSRVGGGGSARGLNASHRSNNNFNNSHRSNNNINNHSHMNNNGGSINGGRIHPLQNSGYFPSGYPGDPPQAPGGPAHQNDSSKLTMDIDTFSSDSEKLSAILKVADVELHKHLLTIEYYNFRKYTLLIPMISMSLIISILGFIAASQVISNNVKVGDSTISEFLTILVSCFGFLIMILLLLYNNLEYNSKIIFHRAASQDLAGLCEKIRMYKMEPSMDERAKEYDEELKELFVDDDQTEVDSDDDDEEESVPIHNGENQLVPHSGDQLARQQVKRQIKHTKKVQRHKAKLTQTLVKQRVRQARQAQDLSKDVITFYGYHTELHSIISSCRSDIPASLSKYFVIMENRVELMSLSRLGVEEESRMRKNQIVRLASNEIYNEISNYILWPLLTPSVDKTIEISLKRVGQLLNMNYRAQRRCKLIPCCPIPLCCKKKTTNNVFAIINEGIDQRELDMMQAERIELIKMENERRARRNAGPEEIVEMKDSKYYDNGGGGGARRRGGGGRSGTRGRGGGHGGRSRASVDPDGDTYAGLETEASYSFASRAGRGAGGYAAHHFGGGRGGGGGGYMLEDEEILTEQDDEEDHDEEGQSYLYDERSKYTEERSKYTEDEEQGRYTDDEEGTDDDEAMGVKKKKKKKKSKKKKKKKVSSMYMLRVYWSHM